jgi:hypothetical protein
VIGFVVLRIKYKITAKQIYNKLRKTASPKTKMSAELFSTQFEQDLFFKGKR